MVLRQTTRRGDRRAASPGLLFCLLMIVTMAATGASAQQPQASGFSIGDLISEIANAATGQASPEPETLETTFTAELDRAVDFKVSQLASPNRLIVDMPNVRMRLPPVPTRPVGVVANFRAGSEGQNRTRLIIALTEEVLVTAAEIRRNPTTNAIELTVTMLPLREQAARDARLAKLRNHRMGLGVAPPLPRVAATPKEIDDKTSKPLIVLDPGHGGRDSGAMKHGTVEKQVVLEFGLVLRDLLLATGRYRVMMTRETDVFIPLGERRDFAERNKADLFIAIHADYATTNASGATIYSLRERVAERLRSSARQEVRDGVLPTDEARRLEAMASADLDAIRAMLADLAAKEVDVVRDRTEVFTRAVIETMSASTDMRRRPDQEAAFKVLRTAKVPSVLIELAYVSNQRDAQRLRSAEWRQKVAASIMEAIDNYFSASIARLPL